MQFFHNYPQEATYNPQQDKLYLTATTKMNLGYWIGCDIDFFYTNYKDELNEFEFYRLKSQHNLAINIFKEGEAILDQLEGPHLDAAKLVCKFSYKQLLEFGIDAPEKPYQNSELDEIEIHEESAEYDRYVHDFSKFMNPNSTEFLFYKSNSGFMDALLDGFKILSAIDTSNEESQEKIQDVVDQITMCRIYLQELPDSIVKDTLMKEYEVSIIGNQDKQSNHSFKNFYAVSMEYIDAWDAYYEHYEQFFKNILLIDYQDSEFDENFNYLLHQEKPLTALATLKAIEISILVLENLNQAVPHFEIYSARKVSSSLAYLIDQTSDQTAKKPL